MLIERLEAEGIVYRDTMPRFPRSTLHAILHDRAYIGEVEHKGQWYPGKHPAACGPRDLGAGPGAIGRAGLPDP